jgi:putative transposase
MARPRKPPSPFRYFKSSPEIIRLVVMMYVKFPLSHVEDLRHLTGRDRYKDQRSAALAEWKSLMA